MSEFFDIWQREVKDYALSIINMDVVNLLKVTSKERGLTKDEIDLITKTNDEQQDLLGMIQLHDMVLFVDKCQKENKLDEAYESIRSMFVKFSDKKYNKIYYSDKTNPIYQKKQILLQGLFKMVMQYTKEC